MGLGGVAIAVLPYVIHPKTAVLGRAGGGIDRVCLKRMHVWNVCISAVSVRLTHVGLIPITSNMVKVLSILF